MFGKYRSWASLIRGRVTKFEIGNEPHLPAEAVLYMASALDKERALAVEYGSGGSTVFAALQGATVVSVESDAKYAQSVRHKLDQVGVTDRARILDISIGWTGPWGIPIVRRQSPRRLARWATYPEAAWVGNALPQRGVDFVLVDGRFRVASALRSLLDPRVTDETRFIFDDFNSSHNAYDPVLGFVENVRTLGRAIGFTRSKQFDATRCLELMENYCGDWR